MCRLSYTRYVSHFVLMSPDYIVWINFISTVNAVSYVTQINPPTFLAIVNGSRAHSTISPIHDSHLSNSTLGLKYVWSNIKMKWTFLSCFDRRSITTTTVASDRRGCERHGNDRPAGGYASAIYGENRVTNANLPSLMLSCEAGEAGGVPISTPLYAESTGTCI